MKLGLPGCLLLVLLSNASAHRLDEYLQATRILVASHRIDLSMDLTPGVATADQLLALIDTDHDHRVSKGEATAYAQRVLSDLRIEVDQKKVSLSFVDISFPPLGDVKAGLGIIRIQATTPAGPLSAGRHELTLTNGHLPALSVYLVNALVPKDGAIKITRQTRDELQKNYRLEFELAPKMPVVFPALSCSNTNRARRPIQRDSPPSVSTLDQDLTVGF